MSPARRRRIYKWELDVTVQRQVPWWRRISPPQYFVASFLLIILTGTLGLLILPGLYTDERLGPLDALFTATSSTCVTGLIVVDTATFFTKRGQAWLLLLSQLGGLGIITFTTLIMAVLGRRMSVRQETLSASTTEIAPHIDYRRLARDVVLFTLMIELVGALLLYVLWVPRFGWRDAIWHALFQSVSAFCNAGLATFSDSLMSFQKSPITLAVIGTLIFAGGIGFLTLEELYQWGRARRRGRRYRLSVHSRLVLWTTGILSLLGWWIFAWLEWNVTMGDLPAWAKLTNTMFMSVAERTAGFSTIDYSQATPSTNFLSMILMTIGGSPGSTAGGLKTTTVALIVLVLWSRLRGFEAIHIWGRTIPPHAVQHAVWIMVGGGIMVTIGVFFYTVTEMGTPGADPGRLERFLQYAFEAISAFNTVGLSMGVTGSLSAAGKWTTIILMFLGRVGLTTAAAALILTTPTPIAEFRYAYEDVAVG
ncbi:TrkH family potassium uptake protein [soil metagenome]